jgi:hypothetical protein
MNRLPLILLSLIFATILISNISTSESVLWDLLITVNVENTPILVNENPMVSGQVVDHAGKAIQNVELQIRIGAETIIITTSDTGEFQHEFVGLQLIPGIHEVNVVATSNTEKIGLASADFQVKGELQTFSHTAKLLETSEAVKYLNADPASFEYDPIGLTLYNYYQELQEEYRLEQSLQKEIIEQEIILDELRQISDDISQKVIDEKNPGAGTFSGFDKDVFIDNLDESIKEIIVNQLDYTLSIFDEAQKAMDEVLQNGGTVEEARQVYFEKASISQETMNSMTVINQEEDVQNYLTSTIESTNSTSELQNNSTDVSNEIGDELNLNVNGTSIQVGMSGTTIYLNVNGSIIEFLVNGTEITQITNSTEN